MAESKTQTLKICFFVQVALFYSSQFKRLLEDLNQSKANRLYRENLKSKQFKKAHCALHAIGFFVVVLNDSRASRYK